MEAEMVWFKASTLQANTPAAPVVVERLRAVYAKPALSLLLWD